MVTAYRIYVDGTIINQDEFNHYDNSKKLKDIPFEVFIIPNDLVEHIAQQFIPSGE